MVKMKLLVSGIAGVLVACLIFTAVLVAPWSRQVIPTHLPSEFPGIQLPDNTPITVNLTISNFIEPHGIGSKANLTLIVASVRNESDVSIQIGLGGSYNGWPRGIDFIWPEEINFPSGGKLVWWRANLSANVPVTFSATIEAIKVGYASIEASATWYESTSSKYLTCDSKRLYISVYENDIFVEKDPHEWIGWTALPSNPINYVSPNETYLGSIIYLEPALTEWAMGSHNVGKTLKLEVRVTNVADLWSLGFSLKWNTSVLELVSVEKGTVLEAEDAQTFWIVSNDRVGRVMVSYLRIGRWPGAATVNISEPENGLVGTITFHVMNYTDSLEISFINEVDSPYKTVWLSLQADQIKDYNFEYMLSATFVFKKE